MVIMASKKQRFVNNQRLSGRQVAQVSSQPAPIGGINAVDAIAAMPPQDALVMENFFPTQYSVNARNGAQYHVTGITGTVETLMVYRAGAVTKMFAIVNNAGTCGIFDVTNAGTVGAAVHTGLSNARWQYVNMSTPAGQYLYLFNGVDDPLLYNGTTWTAINSASTPAIIHVTTNTLIAPELFKNRLFMVKKNSTEVWYLPIQSISGNASALYLGAYLRLGGSIIRVFNMPMATIDQTNNYLGFLSSEGEILLFQGSDPDSDFSLIGVYRVGRPVGDKCIFRLSSEIYFITTSGIYAMSQIYNGGNDVVNNSLSYKILPLIADDTQKYFNNFGWQGIIHQAGSKVLINVPTGETNYSRQYVMNTLTGAWCLFTGWAAYCWETMANNLYYGGNGFVAQADVVGYNSDFGNAIQASLKPAFSYFGTQATKMFTMVRPIITSDSAVSYNLIMNYDFKDSGGTVNTIVANSDTLWSVAWDVAWSAGEYTQNTWKSVTGTGYAATPRIDFAYRGSTFKVQSFDYVWQNGGIL